MSFRIVDLIGDKDTSKTSAVLKKDNVIVSSTSDRLAVPLSAEMVPINERAGLATFDDYAARLFGDLYYERLFGAPPMVGTMGNSYSGTCGFEKALPSLHDRWRHITYAGAHPAPSTHPPSAFLHTPFIYSHYSKRKGGQVRFTTTQTDTLEQKFQSHKYLSPEDRRALAHNLKLSDRQVKTWFQNRRAKWRRCHDGAGKLTDGHSSDSEACA